VAVTVAAVAVSMAGAAVAADIMAAAVPTVVAADITVAGGLMAEEVTTEAAAFVVDQRPVVRERAAVPTAGPRLAAIPVGSQIVRRMFVPQSPMASGIRLATRVVPRVPVQAILRVPPKHAIPEAQRTQASPLVTAEIPIELRQASVEVAMVGEAAMVGGAVGVGEAVGVGASASDGRTGHLAGGSAGILGCTTPTGILQWLTPTRITATMGPTIRRTVRVRRQIRHITMTSRQATRARQERQPHIHSDRGLALPLGDQYPNVGQQFARRKIRRFELTPLSLFIERFFLKCRYSRVNALTKNDRCSSAWGFGRA
jgi:hypothetical protein